MKVQSTSNLPSNRSSFLPKKRSPRHTDSGYQSSSSSSSSPSISPAASSSSFSRPAPNGRAILAPRSGLQRPPLRRSSPGSDFCPEKEKSINQQITFTRELQNLMEVEYREDVQEYMYDMKVNHLASCVRKIVTNAFGTDAYDCFSRAHRSTT